MSSSPLAGSASPGTLPPQAEPFAKWLGLPSTPAQRRAATVGSGVLLGATLVILPVASVRQPVAPGFVATATTFTITANLLTAGILLSPFANRHRAPLTFLGMVYLYAGLLYTAYLLTFPGVFAPEALLGAGPQTAPWIASIWSVTVPLGILGYLVVEARTAAAPAAAAGDTGHLTRGRAVLYPALVVMFLAFVTVHFQQQLPGLIVQGRGSALAHDVELPSALLVTGVTLAALLYWTRARTLLQLALCVFMASLLLGLLATVTGPVRYSLGAYVARLGTVIAPAVMLLVLLTEIRRLYASAERLRALAQQRSAELARANAELETVLRVLPVGVGIADDPAVSRIRMNPAHARMLGLPVDANASLTAPEGERPTNWRAFQGNRELTPDELAITRAVATGEDVRGMELEVVRDDGVRITQLAYASPLRDEQGRVRGAVGAYLDISARVLAERQRDLLLVGMAHDLKNPLSALVWLAEALHRRPRAPEEAQLLERFVEGARQILAQINELVDTTRGQLGRPLELELRRVDLAALVTRLAADQAGGRRIIVGGAETPLPGLFDEARLARVLANVLDNALKYSAPRGEVVVALSRAEGEAGSWATIRVADRGIGIPAAEVERVFEPYYRASNARPGREGSGLGLVGVRQVVEAHGGSVSLESEAGVGTTVTLRLPLQPPEWPDSTEEER